MLHTQRSLPPLLADPRFGKSRQGDWDPMGEIRGWTGLGKVGLLFDGYEAPHQTGCLLRRKMKLFGVHRQPLRNNKMKDTPKNKNKLEVN